MSAKLEKGKKKLNFCAQNQYLDIWHENSNICDWKILTQLDDLNTSPVPLTVPVDILSSELPGALTQRDIK